MRALTRPDLYYTIFTSVTVAINNNNNNHGNDPNNYYVKWKESVVGEVRLDIRAIYSDIKITRSKDVLYILTKILFA